MKTVVTKSMVAHLFANQSQNEARTQSHNFYFLGKVCYSYGGHYVAATHHGDTVLINSNRYSVTTASQLSELQSACSHLKVYDVENPSAGTKPDHRANFKTMVLDYENEVFRASRARVYNSLDTAERMHNDGNQYAMRFKIGNRMPALHDSASIIERIATRTARENAATRREMKAREKRAEKLLAERREKQTVNLAKWRNGELTHYDLPLSHSEPVALRLTSDGDIVQTSQGVEFPTEHAKRSIAFVLDCFANGWDFSHNGKSIQLGAFQVDRINADKGLLLAGCHTVTRDEITHLAALIAA